jgi:hypothetical protein
VEATGGRMTVRSNGVPLATLKAAIEQKTGIVIRVGQPSLGQTPVVVNTVDSVPDKAMRDVLSAFNYSQYSDPKTGKSIYLVTSLASDVVAAPTPEPPRSIPVVTGIAAAEPHPTVVTARTLDDVRVIRPAAVSLNKSQAEIDADYKREREERVSRALDVLRGQDMTAELQRQALNDLVGIDDPRATAMLGEALRAPVPDARKAAVYEYVARAVYDHAAKLNFESGAANQLLSQLAVSGNPAMKQIGETGMREMQANRSQNGR